MQTYSTPLVRTLAVDPADTRHEAQERPRWCVDTDWQSAIAEARALGYTGRSVYREAADALSERYGYR